MRKHSVRHFGNRIPHRPLGPGDDLVSKLDEGFQPKLGQELNQATTANVVAGDLGVDVAQHGFRGAHVGGDQLDQLAVLPPGIVELGDRDEQPFLVDRARVGRQPAPADVEDVAGVAEVAD